VSNWKGYAEKGLRIGPESASVTIVEFADFQCPFCARAVDEVKGAQREHPAQVAWVFRHYPLSSHPFAQTAARAVECADRSGRFADMHDVLYANQDSIGKRSWVDFARDAGVADTAAFTQCMSNTGDPTVQRRIADDVAAGHRLGVEGTPTFLVNGIAIEGYSGPGRIDSLVSAALNQRGK
jgi:protein-disulfide isomerase